MALALTLPAWRLASSGRSCFTRRMVSSWNSADMMWSRYERRLSYLSKSTALSLSSATFSAGWARAS